MPLDPPYYEEGDRVRLRNRVWPGYPRHVLNNRIGTITAVNRNRCVVDFGRDGTWAISRLALALPGRMEDV